MDLPTNKDLIEESEDLKRALNERLELHDNSRRAAQDTLHEICEELKNQITQFENKFNSELEDNFNKEDNRLQDALNNLREFKVEEFAEKDNELRQAIQKAKVELLVMQTYDIVKCENEISSFDPRKNNLPEDEHYEEPALKKAKLESESELILNITKMWKLEVNRKLVPEVLSFRKPRDIHAIVTDIKGNVSIHFTHLNTDEKRVLSEHNLTDQIKYKCLLFKKESDANDEQNNKEYLLNETDNCFSFTPDILEAEATYVTRVKAVIENKDNEWSDETAEFTIPEFKKCCAWKECPDDIDKKNKYSVDKNNTRIATKVGYRDYAIIGNTSLPLNKFTSWNIKILKSKENDGGVYIGVAPFDINQNRDDNRKKCGWYFYCYQSTLYSGPPHYYEGKKYGIRKKQGEYVHDGDSVGVVMDTTNGKLSFILDEVSYGVAYEEIPLDKPLVPCVLLLFNGDSIEFDTSEIKENEVDDSIVVPSNITAKSNTWDSITFTWDKVRGASFYQVGVDGNNANILSTTNTLTKRGLLGNTEYNFKVRTVKGNKVSGWSDIIKVKTLIKSFESSGWKECPVNVDDRRRYTVDDENSRVVSSNDGSWYNYSFSTIIGNASLPLNKVTSWNIKILKSKKNNGKGTFIGVAPFDINQDDIDNYNKCGWYFNYYKFSLRSGPPHCYEGKEYGPRKEKWDGLTQPEDVVGVVMDTTSGDLSFVLNEVSFGVAYEGIPLDKPLVPCIIFKYNDNSVEFDPTSEVKEDVDSSILIPFDITAKSTTWDSITLSWSSDACASFYQIEVNGNKSWYASKIINFIKVGLLPDTEYSFRVRAVHNNVVSKWSDVVKGRTLKETFENSRWKECPDDVDKDKKYIVDEKIPTIATKTIVNFCRPTTIIGNTSLPSNKVTSWIIKILKSKKNDGDAIYIGVAPFDIDQDEDDNIKKCGWYFNCHSSTLRSGPPHNYGNKKYGPRKKLGEYVYDGVYIGVVMNTTEGNLLFALNKVNLGVAYEGIPLDKPLVPCVILKNKDDSIKLII